MSSSDSTSALGSAYPPSQHTIEVLSAGSRLVRSWHDAKARVRSFIGSLSSDYATPRTVTKEFSILTGYFFMGWSDASAGALLPAIQRHYRLSYVAVSMLFVCNLVGWILAAVVTTPLVDRFAFGRCVTIFALVAVVPSAIIAPAPPFAVMAVSYVLYGLSIGAQEAMSNAWVSARPRAEVRLSCLHFLYGCGALCAPLAATPFVGRGVRFSFFYLIALGLASLNTIWVTYSFRFNREGYPVGQPEPADQDRGQAGENDAMERTSEHSPSGARNTFRALLSQPSTSVLALFCLFYVGTEVAIGGWSSTFIIEIRGDAHSSSYLVSGFWAGLAAGRILLLPVNRLLGAHLATFVYLALALGLQFILWFVPSLIANGVSLALMGLFLGPIFPILIRVITIKIRPRGLHTAAIGLVVALGSAGAALFPLVVGLVAQAKGIQTLPPILVALLATQILLWAGLGWPTKFRAEADQRVD